MKNILHLLTFNYAQAPSNLRTICHLIERLISIYYNPYAENHINWSANQYSELIHSRPRTDPIVILRIVGCPVRVLPHTLTHQAKELSLETLGEAQDW